MDVPLSLVLIACVFTTYTKGSNSLQLRNSPATASPGQPYTLMCSSSGSGGRSRGWYWRNDIVFRTRYVSDTQCAVDVSNNDLYNHLSGRVSVTCSLNQQNVTLRILTSTDNGSVWWCVDVRSQESNRLTIYVVNLTTVSPTTTIAATTATTATTTTAATTANFDISTSTSLQEGDVMTVPTTSSPTSVTSFIDRTTTNTEDTPNVVYIVIGVIGGAVVGCVITAAVVIAWMKKRNISREDNINSPNIYDSASHYEDMDHQYGIVEKQYVNTVEGTETNTPDYVNTDEDKPDTAYYNKVHDTNLP